MNMLLILFAMPLAIRNGFQVIVNPFYFVRAGKIVITPPARGGAEDSVRLLLTKNPVCFFFCPWCHIHVHVSRLNVSRGPGN